MAAASDITSPLSRARFAVMLWIDTLSKDAQCEAAIAMDSFMQLAEREIEQAYRDGMNHRSASVRAQKMKQEAMAASNGERQ
jgi:hypothetical protein